MDFKTGEIFQMVDNETKEMTGVSKMFDAFKVTAMKTHYMSVVMYIHEEKNNLHLPHSTFVKIMKDDGFMIACNRLEVNTSIKFTVFFCCCFS